MRVICQSVAEFIENLSKVKPGDILQRIVYMSTSRKPGGGIIDSVKFEVLLQVSAVVNIEDEGQYLLEVGEPCGLDYEDASQEFKGTERASELRGLVEEFCDSYGLDCRPGIIDL